MKIDPATVDAAMARLNSLVNSLGRECVHGKVKASDAFALADAVEHYRQQLAAVEKERNSARSLMIQVKVESTKRRDELAAMTERAERMRRFDPLAVGCQWEDADDIAHAVHRACVAIIDGKEPNQEGNDDGK